MAVVMEDRRGQLGRALPTTTQEFDAMRKFKERRTLTDYIHDIMRVLIADENYRKFLEAPADEEAVEGSTDIDDVEAVRMVRVYAREHGIHQVADRTLKALLRPHNSARKRNGIERNAEQKRNGGSADDESKEPK